LKLSTNPYQQKAYQAEKDRVEQALKGLENFSQNNTKQSGFVRPEVIIPAGLLVVALIGGIIVLARKRKQAKR